MIEPNFYYDQEDILFQYCRENNIEWNIVRPSFILGAVEGSAMNAVYTMAVYAAVQKHKGEKLIWPADTVAWEKELVQSSAMLNSYLSEYVALNEQAGNEAFNATDGSPFTYGRLWTELAKWFGMEFTYPEDDDTHFHQVKMHHEPPRGYVVPSLVSVLVLTRHRFGSPPTIRFKYTFVQWAQRPENQQAWKELAQKYSLKGSPFESGELERNFQYLDFGILGPFSFSMNLTKGRKMGWNGFVDSLEAHRQVIEELAGMNMVPPMD
jgi:hypothetical protein